MNFEIFEKIEYWNLEKLKVEKVQALKTKCTSYESEKLKKILLLMFVTTLTYLSGKFEYIKWQRLIWSCNN